MKMNQGSFANCSLYKCGIEQDDKMLSAVAGSFSVAGPGGNITVISTDFLLFLICLYVLLVSAI